MSFGSDYGENVFWLCHLTSADLARTYQWNVGQWCEEGHLQNIKCSSRFLPFFVCNLCIQKNQMAYLCSIWRFVRFRSVVLILLFVILYTFVFACYSILTCSLTLTAICYMHATAIFGTMITVLYIFLLRDLQKKFSSNSVVRKDVLLIFFFCLQFDIAIRVLNIFLWR